MSAYKDNFTLDGRLKPHASVTPRKLEAAARIMEKALRGDSYAAADLHESHSTTDAPFTFAYLTSINALAQYDALEPTWTQIATVRTLPDFNPAVLTGVFGTFEGLKRGDAPANPAGIAPVVPELAPYPYATITKVEASYGRLKKRGFKVGLSWEARVNDTVGFYENLPGQMARTARDTEDYEVYSALLATPNGRQLAGGTTYDGTVVPANSKITRAAVIEAIYELKQRKVNGNYQTFSGGYNLIVGYGQRAAVEFALNRDIVQLVPGSAGGQVININGDNNELGQVTVIESPYITAPAWYLLPKPGTNARPVLELGKLRGQESPELRVHNLTGNYAGGGAVSPFEGSFDSDSIDFRLRHVITGIRWYDDAIVWSTGVA